MLALRNVTVTYADGTMAAQDVSFTVREGENVALIGGNGAGKTSLLLSIVGILEPSGGAVEADGVTLSPKTVNEVRQRVGLVFQNPDDQLFMPRIYDDVAFGCRNLGWPEAEVEARVNGTLEQLNIAYLRDRSTLKLSGGEKRMAAIATVLAMNPSILMLDEPTAFLDPRARRVLASTLKGLGHAKIIATHDMEFAADVCGRVVVLEGGRVMADGPIALLGDKDMMERFGLAFA